MVEGVSVLECYCVSVFEGYKRGVREGVLDDIFKATSYIRE